MLYFAREEISENHLLRNVGMRIRSILCITCAISLTGCNGSSEPAASRAKAVSGPTETTPASGSAESSDSPHRPNTASEQSTDDDANGRLQLDKLVFTVPEGWKRKPTSSSFVLAELTLPKAEGDDADGRLTVSVAGGSIEANIERWRDQFGGKPEQASEERKEISGLDVALVDFIGEFNDQRGPVAPATKRASYRMLAAIIPIDGELHFVKAVGPQATITAHVDRIHQFIGSVEKKKQAE